MTLSRWPTRFAPPGCLRHHWGVSKAFTRESDDAAPEPVVRPRAPLPPGTRNYITPQGAQRLREELAQLLENKSGEVSGAREGRLRQLQETLASVTIAEPPADRSVIRFGATVTLERGGATETFQLAGLDETDLEANRISWLSPLARALIGHRAGERVRFRSPAGMEEIRIAAVVYE